MDFLEENNMKKLISAVLALAMLMMIFQMLRSLEFLGLTVLCIQKITVVLSVLSHFSLKW